MIHLTQNMCQYLSQEQYRESPPNLQLLEWLSYVQDVGVGGKI
jgi:hypothetical protein